MISIWMTMKTMMIHRLTTKLRSSWDGSCFGQYLCSIEWQRTASRLSLFCSLWLAVSSVVIAQEYGEPDRGQPGDAAIQSLLAEKALELDRNFAQDLKLLSQEPSPIPEWRRQYFDMLGIDPDVPKTSLQATVTGTMEAPGIVVEKLHFQSRPGLYVTGNLYRPAAIVSGEKLPAILYLCGHWNMGRNGNKTAYQSHAVWFAKHGYVCLVLDSLQLGEIAAKHHGTYNLERWWWHSRGYTPAGVECWNGIRAIDYLQTRPDVDPDRIGVTGISGGGAATFWIAAADERVRAAAPVSGMADLESYVGNRVINGHCDCMFLYNHYRWPWTRIATLIAPRPMLFVNSDLDPIFPMDANDRISNRMERCYSIFGASDRFDTLVSVGGHAYREDIRRGVFQFMNLHLRQMGEPVLDAHADAQFESNDREIPFFSPEQLRVFAADEDLPKDEVNTKIDELFVPIGLLEVPESADRDAFTAWQKRAIVKIRERSLAGLPERVQAAEVLEATEDRKWRLASEKGIGIVVTKTISKDSKQNRTPAAPNLITLVVEDVDEVLETAWWRSRSSDSSEVFVCVPRGYGIAAWTRKSPPNYVERSHVLLGSTVDVGRVHDIVSAARWLKARYPEAKVRLLGRGNQAVLVAYAGLIERQEIDEFHLVDPPTTHMDPAAPQFLSVLRTCDLPESIGLLFPRSLTIESKNRKAFEVTQEFYRHEPSRITFK